MHVLRSHYMHSMHDDEASNLVASSMSKFMSSGVSSMSSKTEKKWYKNMQNSSC